ncbi:hypothetical protein AC578_8716 [Pseudocercospora eumusae]|uniref:Autophagy-related protein 27 n=1 Tax=Pseudocercospora eumusae TaxID=321146 RepID=A0A139HPR5_9PEZI|nr:hypothetical protein AC578_8716 [Pseudocercospora eumusae]
MPSFSLLSAITLLPAAISAVTLDCKHVRADEASFNFESLGGPKAVHLLQRRPPSISNTTFTIDLCKPLEKDKNIKSDLQCPSGTRVCGIEKDYNDETPDGFTRKVIPIAGQYTLGDGRHLDPKFTRLKDSASTEDSTKEGVRIELQGGMYEKEPHKAIVTMICDKEWEGTEGFDKDPKMMGFDAYSAMSKREDDKDGDEKEEPLPDLDKGKALQYVSFKLEKDVRVLRLDWKTKHACEGEAAKTPSSSKGGWGFFTWFLIIVFLLIAAYIIFGSWLNYNRYGARGWDLIPHGDTIRDIPYIVKDWTSSVSDRMRTGGSRGGYSAVSL